MENENNEYGLPEIPRDGLEETEYNHRVKYRNLYLRLVKQGLGMTADDLLGKCCETHHILPRCMGGKDDKSNLVKFPVRYHIMSHLVLLEAYPDHSGIAYAAFCMINGIKDYRAESVQKNFSTRIIAELREKAIKSMKITDEQKEKISKANKGRKLTPEQLKIWSEVKLGEKHPLFGKNLPEKVKKKISNKVKSLWETGYYDNSKIHNKRGNNSLAKKIVGPDGKIYECLLDAVEESGIPSTTLRQWMKGLTRDNHGWSYLNPEDKLTRKQKKELKNKKSD